MLADKYSVRLAFSIREMENFIDSLCREPYSVWPEPKKSRSIRDPSWLFGPIRITNEVTNEYEDLTSVIHMYYVYLTGYFGGVVNYSDAPVIVVPHSEWLLHPEEVVDCF